MRDIKIEYEEMWNITWLYMINQQRLEQIFSNKSSDLSKSLDLQILIEEEIELSLEKRLIIFGYKIHTTLGD